MSLTFQNLLKDFSVRTIVQRGTDLSPTAGLYYVEKGFLKITLVMGTQAYSVGVASPGSILNQQNPLSQERYFYGAIQDSVLHHIPEKQILDIFSTSPESGMSILNSINKTISQREQQICIMQKRSAKERIAATLLSLNNMFNNNPDSIEGIPLDKKTLASLSGTVIETLSRNLTEFEDQGIIKRIKTKIMIKNSESLKKLTEY